MRLLNIYGPLKIDETITITQQHCTTLQHWKRTEEVRKVGVLVEIIHVRGGLQVDYKKKLNIFGRSPNNLDRKECEK